MRVLQLHTRYRQLGGEDGVADAEADLLRGAGHDVVAVRRHNSSSSIGAAGQLATYPWNPASNRRLMRLVQRVHPDVVHFHNTWFATSPRVLRSLRRAGIPTVVTIHNYRLTCVNAQLLRNGGPCELCVGRAPWPGIRHRCYHGSFAESTAAAASIQVHRSLGTWQHDVNRFIALTSFARKMLIKTGIPPERILVVPNFTQDPGPRNRPPSKSTTVAFVGRLSPEKGLDVALEAWKEERPDGLRLLVAGEGPERSALEKIADPSVSFLGSIGRDAVKQLLGDARVALFPSRWYEGQPLGVLESFSCGTPVLGSRLGGLADTLEPLGNDWTVQERTVENWRRALRRVLGDKRVDEAGQTARQTFERLYSPPTAVRRLESLYDELCESDGIDS